MGKIGGLAGHSTGGHAAAFKPTMSLAMINYWPQDRSRGKEQTLAEWDRCRQLAGRISRRGGWDW